MRPSFLPCLGISLALCPSFAAAGTTEVESPGEAMTRCAALTDEAARLRCFDELAEELMAGAAPPPATTLEETPPPTSGRSPESEELAELARTLGARIVEGWLVHDEVDPLDASRRLIAMRPAVATGEVDLGPGASAQLLIGCVQLRRASREIQEDPTGGDYRFVTRLGIGWNVYLGSDTRTPVGLRVDGEVPAVLSMYADGQSVVVSGPAAAGWVRRLLGSERLEVDVEPHGDSGRIRATFELSGLERVAAPAVEACAW